MSRINAPARGDILLVNLNPTSGKEIQGSRPVLVVSADAFNRQSGLAMVLPITQGGIASRENGFTVSLMGCGTETQGVVLCDQLRTVDLHSRTFKFVEHAPDDFLDEALDAVKSILE